MDCLFHADISTVVYLEILDKMCKYDLIATAMEVGIHSPSDDNNKAAEEIYEDVVMGMATNQVLF